MKNNNFLKKNKIYLIIAALLIIWVCFVIFIISPSIKLLRGDFDLVQMKLLDVQNRDDKLGKLNTLRDNFEKINGERKSLEAIFHKNNIVDLAKELEIIAQKTENEISISVDEENKKILELSKSKTASKENELLKLLPAKDYFTIKITLVGNYNGLVKFVDKLNNLKYYNTIVSFNATSKKITIEKDKNSETDNVSGEINILGGNSGAVSLDAEEKEKLVLSSDLDVIFYSLEKNNETK